MLNAIVVKRKNPQHRRSQHLCVDAGYRGAAHLRTIQDRGYIPHVVDRRKAADTKRRDSKNKARRWVVEVSHSRSSLKNPLQIPISSSDRCTALKDGHPIARIQARKNQPTQVVAGARAAHRLGRCCACNDATFFQMSDRRFHCLTPFDPAPLPSRQGLGLFRRMQCVELSFVFGTLRKHLLCALQPHSDALAHAGVYLIEFACKVAYDPSQHCAFKRTGSARPRQRPQWPASAAKAPIPTRPTASVGSIAPTDDADRSGSPAANETTRRRRCVQQQDGVYAWAEPARNQTSA
ncbi:IS4 family transposase [Xanthomonas fragariae LMG 25863]|nr:IS4 family transposase [Xanthomonas fragariae LMG 25863]